MLANGTLDIQSNFEEGAIPNGTTMASHALEVVDQISKRSLTSPRRGSDTKFDPPSFYNALTNEITVEEGDPIRLVTKVGPVDDNSLQVNWYKDGKMLNAGSRFSTIMDRGLIVLDILYTIEDDAGDYFCVAKSHSGQTESNRAHIKIIPEDYSHADNQLPEEMMQKPVQHEVDTEEKHTTKEAPRFINQTNGPINLDQSQLLRLEMVLEPKCDGTLVVEWMKDGQSLNSGSRINTFYDRGYCSLEIAYCYPEDNGNYICIARNLLGQAQSNPICLICKPDETIITKTNLTESSISHLKSFENPGEEFSRYQDKPSNPFPPSFINSIEPNEITVLEGSPAYFEIKIDPGNGEKLSFDWYHNNEVINTCSRLTGKLEMNVASLTIQYTLRLDTGSYKCVVFSEYGRAETQPVNLTVEIDKSIVLDPQSKGISAIRALEAELNASKPNVPDDEIVSDLPSFTKQLDPVNESNEGDSVSFNASVEPARDNSLHVEWYKDEKQLINGSRFRIDYERGIASLYITSVIAEDSGEYWLMAINRNGQTASNKVSLVCIGGEKIVTTSHLLEDSIGFQRLKEMEQDMANNGGSGFQNIEDIEVDSPPHFDVKPLNVTAGESGPAKFLVKISGFPRPTLEWKIENERVISDSIIKHYNDGSINYLEINRCSEIGESVIRVIATNPFGSEEAEAILTVVPTIDFRPDLRHITPDNPYKKMTSLKKIECTSELNNAFKKPKPSAEKIVDIEKNTEYKSRNFKSSDVVETEKMYDEIASKLKANSGLNSTNGHKSPKKNGENDKEELLAPNSTDE